MFCQTIACHDFAEYKLKTKTATFLFCQLCAYEYRLNKDLNAKITKTKERELAK
jgi:hypothetical protein